MSKKAMKKLEKEQEKEKKKAERAAQLVIQFILVLGPRFIQLSDFCKCKKKYIFPKYRIWSIKTICIFSTFVISQMIFFSVSPAL